MSKVLHRDECTVIIEDNGEVILLPTSKGSQENRLHCTTRPVEVQGRNRLYSRHNGADYLRLLHPQGFVFLLKLSADEKAILDRA